MRWLEVRRHSFTKKGDARGRGSHLSADGVALARAVGAGSGPFVRVLTSPLPRAIETAIAMGFAVDDEFDLPSGYVAGEVEHHAQWTWPQPYVRYAELIAGGRQLASVAGAARALLIRAMKDVPEGGQALVVSHGGSIEPALVACVPTANHATWGPALSHCDGARLGYQEGAFATIELLRAPSWSRAHEAG